ncbi:MAG: hypothetical protein ACFE68_02920 [Candidatus Hodarchaeota archaeon]
MAKEVSLTNRLNKTLGDTAFIWFVFIIGFMIVFIFVDTIEGLIQTILACLLVIIFYDLITRKKQ